jgi:hypothetical protein
MPCCPIGHEAFDFIEVAMSRRVVNLRRQRENPGARDSKEADITVLVI